MRYNLKFSATSTLILYKSVSKISFGLTKMEISIHVGIWECSQVFALVFLFEAHMRVVDLSICLCLMNRLSYLLHRVFDLAEVIVSLSGLLLFFFVTS